MYYTGEKVKSIIKISKGWIALKWQILWETNKFQVSFCFPFKYVRRFFIEKKNELQWTTKGAEIKHKLHYFCMDSSSMAY